MAYFTFFIGMFKNLVLIILSCKCGKLCMEGKFAKFIYDSSSICQIQKIVYLIYVCKLEFILGYTYSCTRDEVP